MKAAVIRKFGKPSVFEIEERTIPEPGNNQVLIKNFASSINPIDFKSRKGNHKYILGANFPIILGYDFSGEVVKTGKNVNKFKKGDLVFGRSDVRYGGTYAQYCLSSESTMALKPDNLSFAQAAALPLAGLTALQALRDKCNIQKNDKVLIIGATGGVGHFAVQFVNYFGAKSYAVCDNSHQEFLNQLMPYKHIDYNLQDYKKQNQYYNVIFDVVGKENYLTCKHMLIKNGCYITTLPRPIIIYHSFVSLFNKSKVSSLLMRAKQEDLYFVKTLVENGLLKPKIGKSFKLDQLDKAHEYAEKGHTEGKIIINIEHE